MYNPCPTKMNKIAIKSKTEPIELTEPHVTPNALKVLNSRYLKKDERTGEVIEDPKGMYLRIASAVASAEETDEAVEEWTRTFYNIMATNKFVPNTPTVMNAGCRSGSLSACYLFAVEDSLDKIFDTLKNAAMTQKTGGGVGFAFSRLRPEGDLIKGSGGESPGPLCFIDIYSSSTESIQQGSAGRRGANMAVLSCTHPDLVEFICAKENLDRWNNFNVSVGVTDEWMKNAKERPKDRAKVKNPRTGKYAFLGKSNEGRRRSVIDYISYDEFDVTDGIDTDVEKFWTYGDILDLIIHKAWENAEPGLLFLDRSNETNQVPNLGEYEGTNPCLAKGSLVMTGSGYKRVEEFVIGDKILNADGNSRPIESIEKHENYPVFKVCFSDGSEQVVTEAHQFYAVKKSSMKSEKFFEPICLKDLEVGDCIRVSLGGMPNNQVEDRPEALSDREYGVMLGVVLGDGGWTDGQNKFLSISSHIDEEEWNTHLKSIFGEHKGERHKCSTGEYDKSIRYFYYKSSEAVSILEQSKIKKAKSIHKDIPEEYINSNEEFLSGLIDGLFSTDGNVSLGGSHPLVRFSSGSKDLAIAVKRILGLFNIHGRMYSYERDEHIIDGRKIKGNSLKHEVIISGRDITEFNKRIGLSHPKKKEALMKAAMFARSTNALRSTKIVNIEPFGFEDVYDLYEPVTDTWISEGIVSRGCGEQFLLPYSSCNLGSINLGKYIDNGDFDFTLFREDVKKCVRFLDNVVTVNNYPVPEIREMSDKERRIGLGVMGWADLLFRLGIRYGSDKSFELAGSIAYHLQDAAITESEELVSMEGKEPFGAWEGSRPQIDGLPKRRNSYVSTIAPTGTISIIAGCSGGIEPIFSLAFKRQVMKNKDGVPVVMNEIQNDFLKALKEEGLEEKLDEIVEHCMTHGTIQDCSLVSDEMKNVFVSARDVAPEEHVKMQAAWQQHIDNSVSKTINMPKSATENEVRMAYSLAWETGCKGITVYRDGSREMQPMALSVKKDVAPSPVKLDDVLPSIRVKQSSPFGNMHVNVVRDHDGRVREIFAQVGKAGEVINGDLEAICRLSSLYLRSGGEMERVINQLDGIGTSFQIPSAEGKVMSIADALAKALKKATNVPNQPEADVVTKYADTVFKLQCPSCDEVSVVKSEGCTSCLTPGCGWTAC